MKLRLSISPCPNDTFMFDAIINRRIDLRGLDIDVEYHDIEVLNSHALARRADITKCSTALLPAIAESYAMLDSGAALGRGNGPLLVRRRGESTPIEHIAIPGEHTTANALVRRLFPAIRRRTPMLFSDIAKAVREGVVDAGVLIHEGRFVYAREGLQFVADLGLEWERREGLPLPLGAIVAARDLDEGVRTTFEALLRESIAYAFAHPEASRAFIKEHAQELDDKVIESHIALFVNDFSLSLGEEGREAVRRLTGV